MAELLGGIDGMAEQALLRRQGDGYGSLLHSQTVLDRLRSGSRGTDKAATRQALREVSREFEAIFLNQLVAAMRKTVPDGGLIEKSSAEEIFQGMLDEEWAKRLAGRNGPGGLSQILYQQLSRQLGVEEDLHPLLQLPTGLRPAGLDDDPK